MALNYRDELDMPGTMNEEQPRIGKISYAGLPEKSIMVPFNKLHRLAEASAKNPDMEPNIYTKDHYESKNRTNRG